jgi:hypothetical protein
MIVEAGRAGTGSDVALRFPSGTSTAREPYATGSGDARRAKDR